MNVLAIPDTNSTSTWDHVSVLIQTLGEAAMKEEEEEEEEEEGEEVEEEEEEEKEEDG